MSMASCTNGSMAEHLNEPAIEVIYLLLNGLIFTNMIKTIIYCYHDNLKDRPGGIYTSNPTVIYIT